MPIGNPIQKNNDTRVISATATTGQTDFTVTGGYTINAIGVFRNGVRLNNSTDFTAADGSTVSLNVACDAGDTVTFHIFDKFTVANALVGAASTQTVFGNLTLNGELYADNFNPTNVDIVGIATIAKAIIGTGVTIDQSNIDTVGLISATTFTGNLVGNVTGNLTGTASLITVADESSDTTCFPTFVTAATGDLPPKSGTNLTFNSSSGALTATSINGNIVGGTVSGTTGTFSGNVNTGPVLTVTGTEGVSANLYLIADDGDDNGDGWRLNSNQDDNDLTISNNTTGSYVDKFTLLKTGELTLTNDLIIPDKIVHTGDTDTAFRFPAADTIALQTQGTERLYIKSDGKIGINTTTPYTPLELQGDGGVNDATITFTRHGSPANGSVIGLNFYRIGTDSVAGMGAYRESAMDDAYLAFFTQPTGGNYTERVRIDSNGRLLVGHNATSGKSSTLQVVGSGGDSADFARYVASEYGPNLHFIKSRNATAGSHTIIQDDDALGIINFRGSDGSAFRAAAEIGGYVDGTPGSSDMPGRLVFSTTSDGASGPTERLRISSAGVIGANTSSTITDLHTSYRAVQNHNYGVWSTDDGGASFLSNNAYINSSGNWVRIANDHASDFGMDDGNFYFRHIGAGTGNITWRMPLQIEQDGKSSFTRVVSGTSGDHPCLKIDTTSSGTENSSFATGIDFLQATVHKKRLAITKGNAGTGGGDWVFYEDEGNTRQLELFDGGDVEVSDGDLIIGTAAHGIDFSAQTPSSATGASVNNEVLNHYEAGSWTPTIVTGGFSIDSIVYARFVRIANFVHLQMYIGLGGSGNSDNLKFGGMPYAVAGNGYSAGTVDFGQGGIKGTYMRTVSGDNALTFLYPSENTSTSREDLRGNQVGASYVIATITYYV